MGCLGAAGSTSRGASARSSARRIRTGGTGCSCRCPVYVQQVAFAGVTTSSLLSTSVRRPALPAMRRRSRRTASRRRAGFFPSIARARVVRVPGSWWLPVFTWSVVAHGKMTRFCVAVGLTRITSTPAGRELDVVDYAAARRDGTDRSARGWDSSGRPARSRAARLVGVQLLARRYLRAPPCQVDRPGGEHGSTNMR